MVAVAPAPVRAASLQCLGDAGQEHTRIYAGHLFVETSGRRGFKRRYCVLDGVLFAVHREEHPSGNPRPLLRSTSTALHRCIVARVDRLLCINRGIVLFDTSGRSLWLHGGHDEDEYEQWIALFRAALAGEAIRVSISRFGYGPRTSDIQSDTAAAVVNSNGTLRVRPAFFRGWFVLPARAMHVVLSGRSVACFEVNQEGRWADVFGKITRLTRARRNVKWLELELDHDSLIHVRGRSDELTALWELRLEAALRREPLVDSFVVAIPPPPPPASNAATHRWHHRHRRLASC